MLNDFIKKYNLTPANIAKGAGLVLIGLVGVSLFINLIKVPVTSLSTRGIGKLAATPQVAPGAPAYDYGYGEDAATDEAYLSVRNVNTYLPPVGGGTTGDTAEEYEVTDYSARIETRHLDDTCALIEDLKARDYVIFENANTYDKGCVYTFKVKHDNVQEILGIVEGLDPKELSENVYTIKNQIDDFTSETEILKNKLDSIDETLTQAIAAYDEITKLATATQDVETLAKIIDSKLRIIERLSTERISINEQLDRLSRAQSEQLDRLDYTYFYISVIENKYLDLDDIKDSWKASIKDFVRDINRIFQESTISLIALVFLIVQYLLYFFLILVVAKYVVKWVKKIWKS